MSVYVDDLWECGPVPSFPYKYGCHMTADTRAELMDFAVNTLGLKASWMHNSSSMGHFDITSTKRALAVRHGAVQMPGSDNIREKVRFMRRIREQWAAEQSG